MLHNAFILSASNSSSPYRQACQSACTPSFLEFQTPYGPPQCAGTARLADDSTLSHATAEHLEAGLSPGCRTSIDGYPNSLGLDSRLLGDFDLEHAIGIARLDCLRLCRIR